MKAIRTPLLLFGLVLCISAGAQVRWNNVQSGNNQITFTPPNISFTDIGANTYGSNGNRSQQNGDSSVSTGGITSRRNSNNTTYSDGSHSTLIGDTEFITRPDGSKIYCSRTGGQVLCRPQ